MSDLHNQLAAILSTFRANVTSVQELMRFDSNVLEFPLVQLYALNQRLMAVHGDNARMTATNTISMLENIRSNSSLQPHYRQMLNQCNVLLVSYFSSAVGDIFRAGVADAVRTGTRKAILEEEIKIDFNGLRDLGGDLAERAGDLLADHREISFQNLHGVTKAFKQYFDYRREQDEVFNDLILAHACRHVTVHCGGIADRKMMGQLKSARPRTLKPDLAERELIQFTEDEIIWVGERMFAYLDDLARALVPPEPGTSGTPGT